MPSKDVILDLIKTAIITFVLSFILVNLIGFVTISGESMVPTLEDRGHVILNKFSYYFEEPEKDDLVVFYPPVIGGLYYIKRVVATPNDTIEIKDHKVYINDEPIEEPYIRESMNTESMPKITLMPGEYFVMGDNRNFSSDSRDFGPIRKEMILGKLFGSY